MDSVPNLFGSDRAGADGFDGGAGTNTGTNGEVILCEFKCGLLRRDGTKMSADARKGTLRVIQAAIDDSLKQIQWGPRDPQTGFEAEEDFIILPDEAVLKTIKQPGCFMLAFIEQRDRDMYFWFQESKDTDKEAILTKFNRTINTNVMAAFEANTGAQEEAPAEAQMEEAAPETTSNAKPSETPAASTMMPPPPNVVPSPVEPTPAATTLPAATPAAPAKVSEGMRTPPARRTSPRS